MHDAYALQTRQADQAAMRIQRYSRWLSAVIPMLMMLLPLGLAWQWAELSADKIASLAGVRIGALQPWQRVAAFAVNMVPVAFIVFGLARLRTCFRHFACGSFFTPPTIRGLRGFAAAMFGSGLAGLVTPSLLSLVLTVANGPGQRQLVVNVHTGQLLMLLMASLVWIVAAVMARAAAIEEENTQFV
jgi:hypothetical protein